MKVKCVKCLREERFFTPGKVYKVKCGKITNDRGYTYEEETNSEVLKFLSRWYLFEKVKKDKIVKMREKLRSYCNGRLCCNCKLQYPTCRCGHGTHFMTKDDAGNYTMSNREIKAAFNIIFGTGIKEVKRRAKQGEYVKIVDAVLSYENYKNGDILQIVDDADAYVRYGHNPGEVLWDYEYVVLEGYKPDEPNEPNEPKLYNGKIIFTKGDDVFKTGHIYEIKDGKIMLGDKKLPYEFNGGVFRSIEDVRRYFDEDTEGGWSAMTLELIEVVDD